MSIYNSNIYLLSEDRKQIFKYRRQSENTYGGNSLVILPGTQKEQIISTDIDGSVWLLTGTNKLSTEKIITSPRYERRPIPILSMGTNTITNIDTDVTKIYA